MSSFNKWIGMGNLTANPERHQAKAGGGNFVTFTMAINERWKSDGAAVGATTFVPVVTVGKLADAVEQFLTKGRQVLVEGKLHIETYEDQNRVKHHRSSIRAERVEFLNGGRDDGRRDAPLATQPAGHV